MAEQQGVTLAQLQEVCQCDLQTIKRYGQLGLLVKIKHGRYALLPSVQKVIVYLREQAAGRTTKDGKIDPMEESAYLKRAQRELAETRIKREMGELITIPELTEVWGEIIKSVKSMVLAWPSRVTFELPHLTPHDREVMKRVTEEVLRSNSIAGHPDIGPLPESPRDQ